MTRAALAALLLVGCAAPQSYMGLDLRSAPYNVAEQRLQRLARDAQAGLKPAQLDLARRFEDGDGVPEDLDRACRLYLAAATTTGGTTYVYSPPVTRGGPGSVIPITTPVSPGLPVARERLQSLRYRAGPAERAASACLASAG